MTREEYLQYSDGSFTKEERQEAHHRYHMQFAAPNVYSVLESNFDIWGHTQDEYMNDIPLKWWQELPNYINKSYCTLSDKVCVYKAVAKEILNKRKESE